MSGQSAKGMYDTFKRFADESLFSAQGVNPYAQNHPMPEERMAALAELVKTPYWDKKDPPELQFRHDMMRAKLFGFTERPDTVLRHYPFSDTSPPARYARAISAYRFGDNQHSAMAQIDSLIQSMPNNPYFYELKGQALVCFVTLKNGVTASPELKEQLRQHVAKEIGSLARPDDVRFAAGLPKTRSGKIISSRWIT